MNHNNQFDIYFYVSSIDLEDTFSLISLLYTIKLVAIISTAIFLFSTKLLP